MKINIHVKVIAFCIIGFLLLGYIIFSSQAKRFEYLKENGWYTIGVGKEIEKRRTGWEFIYNYKVNNEKYDGSVSFGYSGSGGLEIGGIYFVVFDPDKPKKRMIIKYPAVPAEINLDSIPPEGWSELPVSVPKDSIRNFLD